MTKSKLRVLAGKGKKRPWNVILINRCDWTVYASFATKEEAETYAQHTAADTGWEFLRD